MNRVNCISAERCQGIYIGAYPYLPVSHFRWQYGRMTSLNSIVQSGAMADIAAIAPKLQFSRTEAAFALNLSLRTIDRLIAEKRLSTRRVGRRVLITKEALHQFTRRDHSTGGVQ